MIGAGFERLEAEQLVKAHQWLGFEEERADFEHRSDALPAGPGVTEAEVRGAIDRLPPSLKARVKFDAGTREIAVTRALSRDERNLMHLAFSKVPGRNG